MWPPKSKTVGNTPFLVVLPHNSHRHITVEMLSTTFPEEITHKRVLKDCDEEFKVFVTTMEALGACASSCCVVSTFIRLTFCYVKGFGRILNEIAKSNSGNLGSRGVFCLCRIGG